MTMKNLAFILFLVVIAGTSCAQKGKVNSALNYVEAEDLEKALEAIEVAQENEKTQDWYKTYFAKGRVYQVMYETGDKDLIEKAGDPLEIAYKSYQKAKELDEKGRVEKQIDLFYQSLLNDFLNQGIEAFNASDFDQAYKSFNYARKVGEEPIFQGGVDTSIIYNAGLAAYNGEMYEKAIECFEEVGEMGYEQGTPYILIKNAYIALNDSASALEALQTGFEMFPENEGLLIELINYYLMSGADDEALEYIDMAIERDAENSSYWHARGVLYDKKGSMDRAIESYKKAIELDDTNFNSYYNLGALYFNQGVNMANKALEIKDPDEYSAAVAKADEKFRESLPWLEKAHELNPDDVSTMETLKMLYYRLKMMDKHAEISEKLENL
ncbi:MAG TPA: tetratricopeptide repeat protein [Bacteroidetes bacterium]|nr:tetratricopeptide repeat protein [Bacteroidota bacterium]